MKKTLLKNLAAKIISGLGVGVFLYSTTVAGGVVRAPEYQHLLSQSATRSTTPVAYAAEEAVDPVQAYRALKTEAKSNLNLAEEVVISLVSVVQRFLQMLLSLVVEGTQWMIRYGTTIMEFPAVKAGFNVTLSLINLMFVITLIVIAFQMILGINEGEAKSRLVKLILAALLVNFSLLIAGVLLDIGNILTNFFIGDLSAETIRQALHPERFASISTLQPAQIQTFGSILADQLLSLFMTGLILVSMIAVFATTILRNVWVAVLLLVMPLTWALWVFPGLEKHHHEWWSNFIRWGVTILPSMTFFIYLAIEASKELRVVGINGSGNESMLSMIIQVILVCAIMLAGIKISAKAGGITAAAALGAAGAATGMLAKPLYKARFGKYGLQPAAEKVAGLGSKAMNRLSNIPVIGAAATALGSRQAAAGLAGLAHGSAHDVDEFQKKNVSGLSDEELFAFKARNQVESAAQLKEISKRDKANDFIKYNNGKPATEESKTARTASLKAMAEASGDIYHKHGSDLTDIKEVKDLLDSVPTLAPTLGVRSVTDQIKRMSPSKIAELKPTAFDASTAAGRELIAAVSGNAAAVKAILTSGSAGTQDAFKNGLEAQSKIIFGGEIDKLNDQLKALKEADLEILEARERNAGPADIKKAQDKRTQAKKDITAIYAKLGELKDYSGPGEHLSADNRQKIAKSLANGNNTRNQVINNETII
jgi:hypothetical protein